MHKPNATSPIDCIPLPKETEEIFVKANACSLISLTESGIIIPIVSLMDPLNEYIPIEIRVLGNVTLPYISVLRKLLSCISVTV